MIAEASFTGFIQTLLIIILIILGLRILFRIVAPYFMHFFLNKVGERMQKEFQKAQQQYQQNPYQETGNKQNVRETVINNNGTSKNQQATKQVGDYIEYEEL